MNGVPNSIVREVRRRVQRKPGDELLADTVRFVPIPLTPHKATSFVFRRGEKHALVCELKLPYRPHIYNTAWIPDFSVRTLRHAIADCLARLSYTLRYDKRFQRGKILLLNGSPR